MAQMAPDRQQTLAREVEVAGVGIHSGQMARVHLRPAAADHGIRVRRVDLEGAPEIVITPDTLESGVRCTALADGGARVRTVEHLLAACYALGVDNLRIDIDAEEMPILDGSAAPWLTALDEAGLAACDAPPRVIEVAQPILLSLGESTLMALPSSSLRLTVASVTSHPVAGSQVFDFDGSPSVFRASLAIARTFCYLEEVEALLAAGLARGGSLDNALVVKPDAYSSPLRIENELAAHKTLDLLGDLAVLGLRLQCHVVAVRPGHHVNQQLVKAIWGQYVHQGNKGPLRSGEARVGGEGTNALRPLLAG